MLAETKTARGTPSVAPNIYALASAESFDSGSDEAAFLLKACSELAEQLSHNSPAGAPSSEAATNPPVHSHTPCSWEKRLREKGHPIRRDPQAGPVMGNQRGCEPFPIDTANQIS
jgi:hypothetical protein